MTGQLPGQPTHLVIGRQGKVIRALRVVMRSVASQGQRRVDVELAKE